MNTNPTDELEQIGRIIRRLKTYRNTYKLTNLSLTKEEYMKQHLTDEDWIYWKSVFQNHLSN